MKLPSMAPEQERLQAFIPAYSRSSLAVSFQGPPTMAAMTNQWKRSSDYQTKFEAPHTYQLLPGQSAAGLSRCNLPTRQGTPLKPVTLSWPPPLPTMKRQEF
uniref:Uncharacterized protein n=1 Tax=Prymnesium polylepis TaxID=72548 RepID=A0A7S4MZA8_9EUKA